MGQIIAFSSNKSGVLKTSLIINIAKELSKQEKKILIIDMDHKGDVAVNFDKKPDDFQYTIYDVLMNNLNINTVILDVAENIDIVPANEQMAYFELKLIKNIQNYTEPLLLLKKALGKLVDKYDYVFLDTPSNTGIATSNTLNAATHVLVPFCPETSSFDTINNIAQTANTFKESNPNLSILGIVPTKVDKTSPMHEFKIQACRDACRFDNTLITKTHLTHLNSITSYENQEKIADEIKGLIKELKL